MSAEEYVGFPDGGKCIDGVIEVVTRGDEAGTEGHGEGGEALDTGSIDDGERIEERSHRQPDVDYTGRCFDGFASLTCHRAAIVCVECGFLIGLE